MRIDPTGSDSANGKYGIPADNPVIGSEIYAHGFQNPSRLSFDSDSDNQLLYASDMGQHIQEINIVVSGGNYGWNHKEGTFPFDPLSDTGIEDGTLGIDAPNDPVGIIDPVSQYDSDEGSEVVGGFVYRGLSSTLLSGRYIFGEKGRTADGTPPCDGRLFVLQEVFDFGTDLTHFFVEENDPMIRSEIAESEQEKLEGLCILGFGQDATGEVYVLANKTGTPFPDDVGPTGVVMKVTAP